MCCMFHTQILIHNYNKTSYHQNLFSSVKDERRNIEICYSPLRIRSNTLLRHYFLLKKSFFVKGQTDHEFLHHHRPEQLLTTAATLHWFQQGWQRCLNIHEQDELLDILFLLTLYRIKRWSNVFSQWYYIQSRCKDTSRCKVFCLSWCIVR